MPRASIQQWDCSLAADVTEYAFNTILEAGKIPRQSAILGKQRSEPSRVGKKRPSGCESRIQARGGQAWRREKVQKSRKAIGDKKDGGASHFSHQIVDFTSSSEPAPTQPVLSCVFPHPPSSDTYQSCELEQCQVQLI